MASSLLTTQGRALLLTTPWSAGAYKVALLGPDYAPTPADTLVQAAAYEVAGAGYVGGYGGSGRKTLSGKTVTVAPGLDAVRVDASDLTWTAPDAGLVAWAAVLLESGGSDATSTLVAVLAVPATVTGASDFTLTWPASGLWTA
jgi:hypothetical protein